ncbi:MAG: FeoB-associated Cys-rich membrane protein [Spirochaetales bacterium]|nr:FeoB-associated Cys-rich membrane protein [Spirochaetales bacterium]
MSTFIVSVFVFGGIGLIIVRLVRNARKGKSPCGCGCEGCRKSKQQDRGGADINPSPPE